MRTYTSKQVGPLLAAHESPSSSFAPQRVPAYSATEVFNYVVHPVDRLSRMADEISQGNLHVPELPAKGSDEIAQLARSFNRMSQTLTHVLGTTDAE